MHTLLALLRSRLRLGRCCVELHYGIVLGRRILTQFPTQPHIHQWKSFPKSVPWGNSAQSRPSLLFDLQIIITCTPFEGLGRGTLFKVFNKNILFFRAPVDKETRSPKTTAAETTCISVLYCSNDISAGQTSCLECLDTHSYFFVIYSLSRNSEHPTSSICPPAC